jgi:sterol 14-demethylase
MTAKKGLTKARFAKYTGFIEEECDRYLSTRWAADEGEDNLHEAMAEMIVFTATRCLHGKETRDAFTPDVAALYSDLDDGFSPQAWLFPPWMPFPSFYKRDRAHVEIKKRFEQVVQARRERKDGVEHEDLLHTFLTTRYEKVYDKRPFNNSEVSGLLIALLMAGQHTSSTTSSWFGFFTM